MNGRLVPLTYQFSSGDVAEIIVKPNQKPSLDWLKIVASTHARSKIKAWLRKANRDENIQRGRAALDEECRCLGVPPSELLKQEKLLAIALKENLTSVDELYALIGYGEHTAEGVVQRLRGDLPKRTLEELHTSNAAAFEQGTLPIQLPTSGIDGILFKLSKCCEPIPGDTIIGYVTRGKGITIHRLDCPNLRGVRENVEEAKRLTTADWQEAGERVYQADLEIIALNRVGLAADIMNIFSETKTNVRMARMTSDAKKHTAHMVIRVDTSGVKHLQDIIARLNVLSDILQVHRRRSGG